MARTTAAILAEMNALAAAFPLLVQVHDHPTLKSKARSHPLRYLRIASNKDGPRQVVLITAGLHAREWGPPDALLNIARRLVETYSTPGAALTLPAITGVEFMRSTGANTSVPDTLDLPSHIIPRADVVRAL